VRKGAGIELCAEHQEPTSPRDQQAGVSSRHRRHRGGDGPPGVRARAPAIQRPELARSVCFEHSLTADAGSAWAPSPWQAVQRAAA